MTVSRGLRSPLRGVAQFGRAGALGASGRRFKSYRPDSVWRKCKECFGTPFFCNKIIHLYNMIQFVCYIPNLGFTHISNNRIERGEMIPNWSTWCCSLMEIVMRNLLSRSQLDEWRHFEDTIDELNIELDRVNDYYECLIECDDSQSTCKRICRRILMEVWPLLQGGLDALLFYAILVETRYPHVQTLLPRVA